jgi:hypothetical protein
MSKWTGRPVAVMRTDRVGGGFDGDYELQCARNTPWLLAVKSGTVLCCAVL